jgi:hypothetical protein
MKAGKLPHEEGCSLVWTLSQLARILEAQQLEAMAASWASCSGLPSSATGHRRSGSRSGWRTDEAGQLDE